MRGVKQLSDGRWLLDVRIVHEGKERRKRQTFRGTRAEAERRHTELYRGMERDARSLTDRRGTFAHAVDVYLATRQIDRASEPYLRTLQKDIGRHRIENMRTAWLDYVPLLRARRSERTKRPLSAATVNLYYRWAKAATGAVLQPGEANPLSGIPQLKVTPRDRVLTADEVTRLLTATQNKAPWMLPMVEFMIKVPCRRGELIAMRRAWVNLFTWTVDIPAGVTKNKLPCSKPIPPELRDYFRDLQTDHVFSNSEGRALRYFPYQPWRRILTAAKIHNWRPHDTRHQAVTDMANSNISTPSIKAVAGWTTDMMAVYYHADPHRSAAEIAEMWGQKRTPDMDTPEVGGRQVAEG